MFFKSPKNSERIQWTKHAIEKMRFYGISEAKIKNVLAKPKRREEGIAPRTVAAMQPTSSKKHPTEIWIMFQSAAKSSKLKAKSLRIISVWRYPGISPIREVPIPEEIRGELGI